MRNAPLLLALSLVAATAAAETFDYGTLTFSNGVPGHMRATVEKKGEEYSVTCTYDVDQEQAQGLRDMPLGTARLRSKDGERGTVRRLCLEHYEESIGNFDED